MDKQSLLQKEFGILLKKLVKEQCIREKIGNWIFLYYSNDMRAFTGSFEETLISLSMMEMGPEFYYSYEELDKIADDLIAGKEVKL